MMTKIYDFPYVLNGLTLSFRSRFEQKSSETMRYLIFYKTGEVIKAKKKENNRIKK